uniref:DEAD/DEAH box helicase family protein n=1 Tax=Bifidobacterium pseudocatenulatum TaxID=28026 RepID=UPI0021F61497|nr:DEAD/DEAH box helicase family protein [Bifidobacterium pseudocatenulatum]
MRGYSGWGGCADAFSDKPEWAALAAEIRELLDDDEYAQARASTLTAYYTPGPVVKAMWDALDIGPASIQVLEPGCGTGNFMAGIPENIKAHVSGVELDPVSARIAAALNPDATILNADLADCTIHPGFDLAIGNVPYSGDISLDYRTMDGGTSRLPLHDYFVARSVDALRPGGVAMLLTSRYTLDKRSETMRADLARKAELVGVVRLPSSTFARQAGTEAVTDVLVLRKRERTLDRTPDEAWIHSAPIAVPGYQDVTANVNQAVADDMPAHAVGDIRPVIGRFGGDFDVVFQGDAEQIGGRLRELLTTQIAHGQALSLGETEPAGRAEIVVRPDHVAPFEYSVDQRGVVWYGDGITVTEIAHGQGDEARRLRGMIRLRDLARELQRLELDPARVDDPAVETKRVELDRAYDRFTGEFGRLNDRVNRRAYSGEESGCHLVMALEETDEKGRFVGKAKCLSQRTISPVPSMPDHADSLDDALNISLDRAGRVDLELIARLADTTVDEAEAGLGDRIIRGPDTGTVMPAEDYLTGDVGTKLDRVTAMADRLKRRAGTEAMTEFVAATYATPEDMPATERAGEWIAAAGTDVWSSLKNPYSAESYRDPAPVIERINGRDAWTMGWNRNPELVLALAWRAVEELPESHARVTLERSDTGERKPWHAPAWHQSHGTSPLWDALCWTWRDGDAPQDYAPTFADRRMPVRDLALFVHKIAHTDRLETADKTAILSNLFESYSAHDEHGSTIWTDTTIGAMARQLMPGTDDPMRLAERLATDMSVSEWIWGIARELPDGLRQAREHNAYGVPPRAIDARPDDYQEFRARREEQLGQWRERPEHAKAAHADQADAERLEHVADLLERVQPTPLETEQIKAPLGAPWIPAKDIHDFMMETFNVRGQGLTPGKLAQYSTDWIPQLGQWRVGYSGGSDIDYKAARTYGTEDRNPFQLLEACLNNAQITVTKDSPTETTPAGKPKRVKDQKATMAAIEKANAIRDTWNQWVFKDPARAQRLTALYNRRFNSLRPRHVDGSYLTTPGIAHDVALRPHQKDAVARALRSDEGTLIAHVVGAGKTFEGVTLSHEARRLGKASKPMLVVPNHLVSQWAGDVLRLYPASRILVMDKDAQRNPESVRRFWGRVATGDWDAVVVPESRFSQLHVSKERRLRNMRARVEEFTLAVKAAAQARGDKDPTVKRLEAARKSAETAMQRLRDGKESRDDKTLAGIEFESLGVDMLIVDEAHHFKNLGVPVASADLGMQLSSAAKCEDLLDKCEWLREAGHGGNIAFMTGTPVSNSMSELYNMQRYLAPGTLKAQDLDTFAAWAGAYGQVVPTVELKPEGNGFQVKQRFARFQNLPELMNAVKQFTDMITNDDIQLPLPELEQVPVPVPITDRQKEEMEELSDRADRVRDGDVPPEADNLLKITGDGRKIALDPKLLKGHEDDRPLENGKIQACAENVARIWHEETPRLGTQLVFCDSSTPASGGWNAYQDLKDRLIQLGVPAEQIAFVHDAGDNPAKRERLFAKVRSGEIRVLMGSTQKLGTGTNVQERLAAIHDLDCPWRPADLEQRLGRIQRQGNMYDHVRDYRYVTEGTFDAYSYQTVERKQRFISQLMSSKSPAREAADLDADVVTLANIKALATGDPDIQRRMTLENEINQLKLLRVSWAQQKADTRRDIGQQLQPRVELLRQSIREKADDKPLASKALSIHQTARMNGRWEGMTINGQPVGDRQTACRLLHQAAHQAHDGDTIAEYDGLPVIARRAAVTGRITLAVKAVHEHESGTEMPGPYLTGLSSIVSQLDRLVRSMATDPGKLTDRLADAERELAAARETLAEPFAHEDEYRQKQAELERLTSKPDEPRETESRDRETTKTERSARMPLTRESIGRLLERDPDIDGVTQGGNAMGHYLEARLTDGRAVQIDFHDNPAWKDTDRLAGRIEVTYANRPQAEWQYDDNDMAAVGILHGIVGEVNAHDPENDIAAYLTYPSDKAVQLAGDGLTAADIAEKREMGGWNPRTDQLMRINAQGDWTGVTQQQADQLVWDNRDEILARASYDGELSTWTLRQLDQLDEPSPERDRGLDRQEPERPAPAREQPAPKRHGLGL